MAAASSSSSSVAIDGFTYDVFLSFRGEDTRYGFTGSLWKALHDRGIHTFIDDEEIRKGEEITPTLLKAIEQSRMAIVVLSQNYATSSFCLNELSHILDCIKGNGRLVWPVFYEVNPSDVRRLEGTYKEAMDAHEVSTWYNTDTLQKWKKALNQVANLSGTHYKWENGDKYQYKFIEEIVKEVSREIKPFTLYVADYVVGLESQKQNVISLLNVESDDKVHMVGIHGIGGIGKTTLALTVYNLIAHQYQGSCFLENVRENSEKHGLLYLQNILLSKTVRHESEQKSVREAIPEIQRKLGQKKVLLLLDDVDKMEQLEVIAGKPEWFGPGSRVIITTRDKGLLTCHGVIRAYDVKELKEKDAVELLRWKAFKTNNVSSSNAHILNHLKHAVKYASGLPLALEVLGSHLFRKGMEEWKSILDRYKRIPNKDIQKVLEESFHNLEEEEKSVFLDIACCFKGQQLAMVEKLLHAHHGDSKKYHIRVLVEKSLIKISESGDVTLHDLIEDMGKEIVKQESPEDPGKRSRLWLRKDIAQVFEKNTGTSKIEIIYWDSWIYVKWNEEAFKKMENLRTLVIDKIMIKDDLFPRSLKYLPNSVRILHIDSSFSWMEHDIWKLTDWKFTSIMERVLFKKASVINLYPSSSINKFTLRLFIGSYLFVCLLFLQKFENMRILILVHYSLTKIPDVSGLPNLEEFSFQHCAELIAVDDSVGLLGKLKILRAEHCRKLRNFPPLKLVSLEELYLLHCYSLESFPPVVWLLEKLQVLRADHCRNLRSFPPLKLASLEQLHLSHCHSLESFPPMMDGFLGKLKILCADNCLSLRSFPPVKLASLEQLDLSLCLRLESFPPVVDGLLGKLKVLRADNCLSLRSFPPLKLASLEQLHLSHCKSLESFPPVVDGLLGELKILCVDYCLKLRSFPPLKLASLEHLNLSNCVNLESFPSMVDGLLGKLKILNAEHCGNLRSMPPLDLPSLEQLNLSHCDFPQGFPEISGEMENITHLYFEKTRIKELPLSFQNVTRLQTLCMYYCGIVQLPSSIVVMSELAELTIQGGGWLFPKQDEGEEKERPIQSSEVEFLRLQGCSLSDESLAIGLKWFANVKELHLTCSKFTTLPECIEKCQFLWKLDLDNCKELQEIKGIPPSLKTLSALNCKSLTLSCKNKLLNQELHEAGNTSFLLPQAEIPEWFDHQRRGGLSVSFRFRNKFPDIALCVVSELTWNDSLSNVRVIINNNERVFFYRDSEKKYNRLETYHLHLFHMQMENFNENMDKAFSINKWNHAKIDFGFQFLASGIHVLKEKSSMEDIEFTNPYNHVVLSWWDHIPDFIREDFFRKLGLPSYRFC